MSIEDLLNLEQSGTLLEIGTYEGEDGDDDDAGDVGFSDAGEEDDDDAMVDCRSGEDNLSLFCKIVFRILT